MGADWVGSRVIGAPPEDRTGSPEWVTSRFWLSKRTQIVVHEEAQQDGVIYVKTLVGAEAGDVAGTATK